jgi:hypothetical protein
LSAAFRDDSFFRHFHSASHFDVFTPPLLLRHCHYLLMPLAIDINILISAISRADYDYAIVDYFHAIDAALSEITPLPLSR